VSAPTPTRLRRSLRVRRQQAAPALVVHAEPLALGIGQSNPTELVLRDAAPINAIGLALQQVGSSHVSPAQIERLFGFPRLGRTLRLHRLAAEIKALDLAQARFIFNVNPQVRAVA
jgi:hypothetical protein